LELIFLKALAEVSFENWVNRHLQAAGHIVALDEEINRLFNEITEQTDNKMNRDDFGGKGNLVREIHMWLEDGKVDYRTLAAQADINPLAALVACFKVESGNKAEILMERYPNDPRLVLVYSILALDEEPEKALQKLTNHMRSNVTSPQHYAALALLKQKLGQPEDAYAAINLALAAWPNEFKWHILAGEISKTAGDVHTSLNHFQKAAELDQNGESQTHLGKLNLQAGNYLGISFLESQLEGNEHDFDKLLELGELSLKNDKPQKAVKYFEKAKKIDPADYRPHLGLSRLALKIGNLKKAQENLEVAYLIAPSLPAVCKQKAAILAQTEGAKAALDYLERENGQTKDQSSELTILKSQYIAELQGEEQALDFLQNQQGQLDNSDLQLALARQYLKLGRADEAVAAAESVLRADPGNPYPLELIARAAQQNGDLDKAIDLLIKAVQVNPFEPVFYLDIAKIYQSRRDNQQAIEILESGVRTNPYHFDLLHHLGLLYYQQGAYKQADICLRQAAAIRPEDENLKRMLSTLTNANIIQEEPISNMADFEE
jgi:tetratricopeptide (TPR) repeat protein